METVGMIASLVAAFAAVATLVYTVLTSKAHVRKRIENKRRILRDIDGALYSRPRSFNPEIIKLVDQLQERKKELQKEIDNLQRYL